MIKSNLKDFVPFDDPTDNKEFNYTQEDVENLGWWNIEKDSCILFDVKIKDGKVIQTSGDLVDVSDEDLAKGRILKLFCKILLEHLGNKNPLLKKYQLFILDDDENSFALYNEKSSDNFCIRLVRTWLDIDLKENRYDYLKIDLKNEPNNVEDYLRWLFVDFEWNEFRELFGYSPVVTEEKNVVRIDPDEEFNKILSKTWNEVGDSEKYKQIILSYQEAVNKQ